MGVLRDTFSRLTVRQAVNALGDIVAVELALNRDSPERLAAAKELNKVAGRYRESIEATDLMQLMTALTSTQNKPKSEPNQADESVETILDIVDLTRKPESK